jgi:hypothetical protein
VWLFSSWYWVTDGWIDRPVDVVSTKASLITYQRTDVNLGSNILIFSSSANLFSATWLQLYWTEPVVIARKYKEMRRQRFRFKPLLFPRADFEGGLKVGWSSGHGRATTKVRLYSVISGIHGAGSAWYVCYTIPRLVTFVFVRVLFSKRLLGHGASTGRIHGHYWLMKAVFNTICIIYDSCYKIAAISSLNYGNCRLKFCEINEKRICIDPEEMKDISV